MSRATPTQTQAFYEILVALVTDGDVLVSHPLRRSPIDPHSSGALKSAPRLALWQLQEMIGNWTYKLRCLYYGYVQSGYNPGNIRLSLAYLTMYDDELRELLRSHEGDDELFPSVFLPDVEAEARHYAMLRQMDSGYVEVEEV